VRWAHTGVGQWGYPPEVLRRGSRAGTDAAARGPSMPGSRGCDPGCFNRWNRHRGASDAKRAPRGQRQHLVLDLGDPAVGVPNPVQDLDKERFTAARRRKLDGPCVVVA